MRANDERGQYLVNLGPGKHLSNSPVALAVRQRRKRELPHTSTELMTVLCNAAIQPIAEAGHFSARSGKRLEHIQALFANSLFVDTVQFKDGWGRILDYDASMAPVTACEELDTSAQGLKPRVQKDITGLQVVPAHSDEVTARQRHRPNRESDGWT